MIKINYAELEFEELDIMKFESIESISILTFKRMKENVITEIKSNRKGIVFLLELFNEVYVSQDIALLIRLIADQIQKADISDNIIEASLHEYYSYEEAYKVALMTKETSSMCYENN